MARAASHSSERAHHLNQLIALDYDAIAAYEAAIDRLDDERFRRQLAEFKRDHERHINYLSDQVRELGGEPAAGPDAKQILTKGKVVLADLAGDKAILKAMESNEEQTNAAYEKAVMQLKGDVATQNAVQENLEDERRHRAWLREAIAQL